MSDDLVLVLTVPTAPEGYLARARLEDEGIPVLIKGESEGPYRLGPVHLFVTRDLEVQARLVVADLIGSAPDGAEG